MVLELSERSQNTCIKSRWCNISFANENCYFALFASSDAIASVSISHFVCVSDQVLLVLKIKYIHDAASALVLHLVASYYLLRHALHLYLVAIMFCGLVLYSCTCALLTFYFFMKYYFPHAVYT